LGGVEKGTRALNYRIEVKRSAAKALKKIAKADQKRMGTILPRIMVVRFEY
jgi:hypothetical protein